MNRLHCKAPTEMRISSRTAKLKYEMIEPTIFWSDATMQKLLFGSYTDELRIGNENWKTSSSSVKMRETPEYICVFELLFVCCFACSVYGYMFMFW
ncbi:hypothetical protein AVEN_153260-1 [Araneus ventricosus]|uniref:Uncharacterized protein n=1 Tax=Araneus ventricosus TaxID=182803 RepID=A0A4Y2K2R3_ARAVE|nr:hypothetical protein AVEN_153260-1 [Araneus ventricosus]